ncbi:3-hydroxybutyrate dehydrogenase [Parvularcula dongshanensis]|uniref:3-hydroxybutyrate dehydrogenase n=1 Tax=Parvularcula dongshanensis TaxID=1173995 RepID=A0A840I2Q1_9PROT|nr:3-hydroxybutyrate dehydrogenase [Parvularcula dongshanensis]MBB4658468.1 3-hydroxybutyrate dehydrogenase [Parvularcula dongshanensis]
MFEDLKGRSAVVTGSTSGIGLHMAEALAKMGVALTLNGLGEEAEIEKERKRLEDTYGVTVRFDGANLMDQAEIRRLIADAEAAHGKIDILVNNAGMQKVAPIDEYDEATWDRLVALNLSAVFHATKAVLPGMKKRRWGRIVNTASAHGLVASPFKAPYVATKHAVLGFSKAVALEVAEQGITVNSICPGYTLTPLVENQVADTAKARGMTEEEVKSEVMLKAQPTKEFVTYEQLNGMLLYLCSDAGASCTGSSYVIDGGWTAQ